MSKRANVWEGTNVCRHVWCGVGTGAEGLTQILDSCKGILIHIRPGQGLIGVQGADTDFRSCLL